MLRPPSPTHCSTLHNITMMLFSILNHMHSRTLMLTLVLTVVARPVFGFMVQTNRSSSLPTSIRRSAQSKCTSQTRTKISSLTTLTTARTILPATANDGMLSGLMRSAGSTQSRLASAFAALSDNDQYDAVLTGLCAKILDDDDDNTSNNNNSDSTTKDAPRSKTILASLQDPFNLLTEMNNRRIQASPRSIMALVDAAAKAQNAGAMAETLRLCLRNNGLSNYGSLQTTIVPLPDNPTTRIKCPDGTMKTRQERLDTLNDLPQDERSKEISSALAASMVVGFCGSIDVLPGMVGLSKYTNVLLTIILTVGFVDNCYDVLGGSMKLLQALSTFKETKVVQSLTLPKKGSLPLGLGTGKVSGTVAKGLTRLINVDTERECECEAAAFFAAYSLGLPCFAFQSNALEGAVLILESSSSSSYLDPLDSNVGVLKMLIWLMAPVAMESSKHMQLIVSDPREPAGLLQRLEQKPHLLNEPIFWENNNEKKDLLKWAYAETDALLRTNKDVIIELTKRLAGGAATVGDCVAVLEEW